MTHYDHETWTWFPDGDESKARTRVTVTSDAYGGMQGVALSYALNVLGGFFDYIHEIEKDREFVHLRDITFYGGQSAFSKWMHATYERPATENEVNSTRVEMKAQREKQRQRLLKELEELGE